MRELNTYSIRVKFPCELGVPDVVFYDIKARNVTLALSTARSMAASRIRVEVLKVTESPNAKRKKPPKKYRIACFGGGFSRELTYRTTIAAAIKHGESKIAEVKFGTRHKVAEISEWSEEAECYKVVKTLRND